MPLLLSDVETLLGDRVGANLTFVNELNLVRARLLQGGSWRKEEERLTVYADSASVPIVSVPFRDTILAGALSNDNVLCSGLAMGVRDGFSQFNKTGLGYGGLTDDFTEVFGQFAVFHEWSDPMRIRIRPEVSESGYIYLSGTLDGQVVHALNGGTWEARERIAFNADSAITSTKYYDAALFKVKKSATNGRLFVYTLDDEDEETLVAIWDAAETLPRYRRYRVPECEDVSPVSDSGDDDDEDEDEDQDGGQSYTEEEIDAAFEPGTDITVGSIGTTTLNYASSFFIKTQRIVASAGNYTRTIVLSVDSPRPGAMLYVPLEVAASGTVVLAFRNASAVGTLLQTITGDSSGALYVTLIFNFYNGAWRYVGRAS